jgi:hypothetical protein
MQRTSFQQKSGVTMTARTEDPITSKLSAVEYKLPTRQQQVLEALIERPRSTAAELGVYFTHTRGLSSETPHKRLPELERQGRVVRGLPRTCRVSGRQAAVWQAL